MSLFGGIGRAYVHRNFQIYSAGSSISLMGTWLQKAAVGWLAWELTHQAFWVGVVVSADLVPAVLTSPFAGLLADRMRGRGILMALQALMMVQAGVLAILAAFDVLTIELLILLTVLLGIAWGFNQPIRQSILNNLVPREDLPPVVAMTSVLYNLARVIGPATAGYVVHYWGAEVAFALNALSFVAFIAALGTLDLHDEEARLAPRVGVWHDILAGYRYTVTYPGIAPIMVVSSAAAILIRPAVEMLPAFVGAIFAGGADDLGLIMTANGAGALLAAAWMAWRGAARGLVAMAISGIVATSVFLAGFASTNDFWIGMAFIFVLGFAMSTRGTAMQTLIQNAVDPAMRGRVLSTHTMLFNAGPSLGSLILGSVAGWAGLQGPLYVAAALNLAVWFWVVRRRATLVAALEQGAGPPRREGRP